ncbi:MAG: ERF family protein [Gammaproteobacteria bacterium]
MEDLQNCTSSKKLAEKMILISEEVQYIQKQGRNQFHKYNYVTDSDVVNALSKAMQKHKVFMFSSVLQRQCTSYETRGNKNAFLVSIQLQVTFIDVDSGESMRSIFYGDGSDSDDKGVYKAITGAQKYALMKTFLVATGDDPEKDTAPAHDEVAQTALNPFDKEALIQKMTAQAHKGTVAFRDAWKKLSRGEREALGEQISVFQEHAEQADLIIQQEDIQQ